VVRAHCARRRGSCERGRARTGQGVVPRLPTPALQLHIAIRTRYYDDYLLAAGCRQVVLLGAGLDPRAYRLHWPEGTSLFELDLPGWLREHGWVVGITPLADLAGKYGRAGADAATSTFVSAER
jgi:O-methyltransferase involved in polyketide biosynthesis